jgi:hypothetical protein
MNPARLIALALAWVAPIAAFGQQNAEPPTARVAPPPPHPMTKFSLDFKGGTPGDLVAAIEKAMGKPLNAIVPPEYANQRMPAMKMDDVDASQLFSALNMAESRSEPYYGASGQMTYVSTSFGFATDGLRTDNSVWYFFSRSVPKEVKICLFFSLAPYLDQGLTVDDITTAIQTGWSMLGESPVPTLSFHKETKLLIAVGSQRQLGIIGEALQALHTPPKPKPSG